MKRFGKSLRKLRIEKGLTREELCGDESELSIRQLARIESGESIPNLARAVYIARQLQVTIDEITGGESLELPKRYQELKYVILRIPTYADEATLDVREAQFDEIFETYYDNLPEEEQVVIDCLQSKFEVYKTGDINFGVDILQDYIDQIMLRSIYRLNDLVILDLYLTCAVVSKFAYAYFDEHLFETVASRLLTQRENLQLSDKFWLNHVVLNATYVCLRLKKAEYIQSLLNLSQQIMRETQDFQKMPLYYMYRWKCCLWIDKKPDEAVLYYQQAIHFSELIDAKHLTQLLREEWKKDSH